MTDDALREAMAETLDDETLTDAVNRADDATFPLDRGEQPTWGEVLRAALIAAVLPLVQQEREKAVERAMDEHTAALCPEDVGCQEWIAVLTERAERLESTVIERDALIVNLRAEKVGAYVQLAERDAQIVALQQLVVYVSTRLRERPAPSQTPEETT